MLDKTCANIRQLLVNALPDDDLNVIPATFPPCSPIAPLTRCPEDLETASKSKAADGR
jgi:hypothetical protein